jgi:hypothetical protein
MCSYVNIVRKNFFIWCLAKKLFRRECFFADGVKGEGEKCIRYTCGFSLKVFDGESLAGMCLVEELRDFVGFKVHEK